MARLYVFISYRLINLNSLMITSVPCDRSKTDDMIFIVKRDKPKLRDFLKLAQGPWS